MLMDIGTEELSYLEVVGTLARMHLKPMKKSSQCRGDRSSHRDCRRRRRCIAKKFPVGDAWTADYLIKSRGS